MCAYFRAHQQGSKGERIDSAEVKRKNILHHNVEANLFETIHPEGSSSYEKSKVSRDIRSAVRNLTRHKLSIDVGCGTGFVTSFELGQFETVVGADISKRMLEVTRARLRGFNGLSLLLCDAENLPLRSQVADFVSVSSVLHHLPNPLKSLREMSRVLKTNGLFYVIREPNDVRFRRFFHLLDEMIIRRLIEFAHCLPFFRRKREKSERLEKLLSEEGLNYREVDIHCPSGFNIAELSLALSLTNLSVVSANSYHWVFFDFLSRVNLLIEKIPFSEKIGRYICLMARKQTGQARTGKNPPLSLEYQKA